MDTEWLLDATEGGSDLLPMAQWAEQLSLSLLPYSMASDPTPDVSQCVPLLHEFANNSATLSNCLVTMARPVRLCQHCYKEYAQLKVTMSKIGNPEQVCWKSFCTRMYVSVYTPSCMCYIVPPCG